MKLNEGRLQSNEIIEYLILKEDKYVLPTNFVVLDIEGYTNYSFILQSHAHWCNQMTNNWEGEWWGF